MQDLTGKVAVVTGAGSGIGRALAERFAAEGMKLVVADVEAEALARTEATLSSRGAEVLSVQLDVLQPEQIEALAERTYATFGAAHVVCNNAGVVAAGGKPSWEETPEDWEWVLGVNLWGVIHGVRAFVPRMLDGGDDGHIVNTASAAGLITSGFKTSYDVSKFGVLALTESLYREMEAIGSRIGVSVLCPGPVSTKIMEAGRNRPGRLENDAAAEISGHRPEGTRYIERLTALVVGGVPPAEMAEAVLQAIREKRFYILPHTEYDAMLRARFESIMERGNPPTRA
ncbi:MAG: SDR family NAD(P)-dependent oxidoreductase [Chloroflexota bacterium]